MRKIDKAEKKIEIAIDKLIDLQDMGYGSNTVALILEMLNRLLHEVNARHN